ncbi:Ubiquinone biosynthesis O-methyltransferase, mitochondrial [subsurface metagenome]
MGGRGKSVGNKSNQCGEENRKYNRNRPQYRLALKILDYVDIRGKLLDCGSGTGEFADIMKETGFQVVCVDGSDTCIESVRQRGLECHKVDLEYQRLPFNDNEFDIVVSLEVIEHLWNTGHYLAEIVRVLKPNGYAIFTTPNYNCWNYRIQHVLGNFEKFTYKSRHKKFYTVKSFKEELENYFEVKRSLGIARLPIIQFSIKFQNLLSIHIGILGIPKKS